MAAGHLFHSGVCSQRKALGGKDGGVTLRECRTERGNPGAIGLPSEQDILQEGIGHGEINAEPMTED